MPFREAASSLGVAVDTDKALAIHRSRTFQTILWQARFDFYTEIASNPTRTKTAALGLMTLAIENLAKEGEWEKVLEGVLKLAKVEGWVGNEASMTVFANVTQKDIEAERKRLLELLGSPAPEKLIEPNAN